MTDFAQDKSMAAPPRARAATGSKLLRSDWFTIVVHWTSAIAMFLAIFTGLRIASDDIGAVISRWFLPILVQGDMWTVHFWAGLAMFASATAYLVYLKAGALFERNSLNKLRVLTLPTAAKLKWGAVNVALHWLLYAVVLVMVVTGVLMYTGRGGWVIAIHRTAAYVAVVYIFAHIISHFMYGGWWQLLRIFVPQSLKMGGVATSKPAWLALAAAVPATFAAAAVDLNTRPGLRMLAAAAAPDVQKLLSDPMWDKAKPVFVHTSQGANMGGTGESLVEVRALRFGEDAYFAFRWEDPSRSVARMPIIKKEDGWHMLSTLGERADVQDFYEDKFSVLVTDSDAFGDGGIIHLGAQPIPGKPKPLHERGFHFTSNGEYVEMWQWKSTRGGVLGNIDHQYMGPPREPTDKEVAVKARYQGGYWNYDGAGPYMYNFAFEGPPDGYKGPIKVQALPKDLEATKAAMGRPITDPEANVGEDQRYWMWDYETVPYSAEADAGIPVGTMLPGVILKNDGKFLGERGEVTGAAKWADGHWTLIAKRTLKPVGKYDHTLEPGTHVNMYVAAYDHTQTRHTRHQRPIQLVVE